jgi:hypothetical protein
MEHEIDLMDDEPNILKCFLSFLYQGDYDYDTQVNDLLLVHAKVYIMADKYDMHPLKVLAATKYKLVVTLDWRKSAFLDSARLLYSETVDSDRQLRDVIAQTAKTHLCELLKQDEFVSTLRSHIDMAVDILKLTASNGSIVVKGAHGDLGVDAKKRKADKYH